MMCSQFWLFSTYVSTKLCEPRPVEDVGEQRRQQQDGAGEDDRDHAGLVDLERDVGALAAVLRRPTTRFGELARVCAAAPAR